VPQPQVDIILYLHDHKEPCGLDDSDSIDAYWSEKPFRDKRLGDKLFTLRKEINCTGKNVILVAPTLGPKAQFGGLTNPRIFEAYLNDVLAALTEYGPYQNVGTGLTYGNIILACHSAGGVPMRQLARGEHAYADRISECWGFDCLYHAKGSNPAEEWAEWADEHKNARLFIHYLKGTRPLSEDLKNSHKPNVVVEKSTATNHCVVPKIHWQQRLKASSSLKEK